MKVMINRARRSTAWGGGTHFATSMAQHLEAKGHEVTHALEPGIDAILMIDPRPEDGQPNSVNEIWAYKRANPNVKVIHRVNDTDKARLETQARPFLDQLNIEANRAVADRTVFISEWLRDYYVGKGFDASRPNVIIRNGCERKWFHPPATPRQLDPANVKLVTHHWSNNPMKGLDLYQHIDGLMLAGKLPGVTFTYVGRFPREYVPSSPRFKVLEPKYGQDLGDELRRHDIYVTAARWEACGSHHVEGAACGLPVIYHEEGGGVAEMCRRYGVGISSDRDFEAALASVVRNHAGLSAATWTCELGTEAMCEAYEGVIVQKS